MRKESSCPRAPSPSPTSSAAGPSGLAIETRGLTKRFGERTALDGIDLQVPRGSAFGFLGPNGAGKTTIIRTLLGLTAADEGTMQVLGHPVPHERAQALQRVGAIVEEPRFHMHLSGRENLKIVAAVRGPRGAGARSCPRWRASGSPSAPRRRSRATRWACASASASPAACWPTRCC